MSAFTHNFNLGFFHGMFNGMFGGFNAFNWGCLNFTPSFFTPNFNFGNFLNYQSPTSMPPSVFSYNVPNFSSVSANIGLQNCNYAVPANMNMNWQNFDYSTPSFQTNYNGVGDTFVRSKSSTAKKTAEEKVKTKNPAKKKSKGAAKGCFNSWAEIESYVHTINLNGKQINVLSTSCFNQATKEWKDLQSCLIEAAEELGLTLVYSDVCRSKKASDAARAVKGNAVAEGGKSPHNYGVGADIMLFDKNGNAIPVGRAGYKKFADLVKAKSGGKITWGGDWSGTRTVYKKTINTCDAEAHHFELKGWQALKDNGTLTCIP